VQHQSSPSARSVFGLSRVSLGKVVYRWKRDFIITRHFTPPPQILGKAEWLNPGGSIKDRTALGLVLAAEGSGALKAGGTVVEGTAGNTGIGLAHICNSRGYRLVIYMPNTQSQEKVDLLRMLGAEVRPVPVVPVTDSKHFTFQARDYAASLPNAVWTNQFDNTANRDIHAATTGPELWTQTGGKLDAFVCATGTGGTLAGARAPRRWPHFGTSLVLLYLPVPAPVCCASGVGRYLKEASGGKTKVFLADPPGSVLHSWVTTGKLERSGSSITEGIGQGRITDNMAGAQLDGAVAVEDARTIAMTFRLLADEGIFAGASSALNVVAACDVAQRLGPGHTVATVICDGAYRYQARLFSKTWLTSKGLFEAIPADCRRFVTLP